MISASSGRVRITAFVSGMTRLTKCSEVPLTWGMAMLIWPSAVWIGFGRVPLREPVAFGVAHSERGSRMRQPPRPPHAARPDELPVGPVASGAHSPHSALSSADLGSAARAERSARFSLFFPSGVALLSGGFSGPTPGDYAT